MPRQTKSTRRVRGENEPKTKTLLVDASDEPLIPDPTEEASYDEIVEVLEGLPSDGDVLVSRFPESGGKREALGELDLASFSVNFLASRWGAGKYFLQFRAPNAAYGGRKTIVTAKVVVIGQGHLAIKPVALTTTPTTTPTAPSSFQQMMDAGLLAMIGSMTKMVTDVANRPAVAPDNGVKDVLLEIAKMRTEDTKTMMQFMEKITTAIASRRGEDPYELAVKIAQLQGGRSGVADAKEMIGMALEMAEMVGGKGKDEPEDMMTTAFKGFMEMLGRLEFAGGARAPEGLNPANNIGDIPAPAATRSPVAATEPVPSSTPTPAGTQDMNAAMLQYLKGFVDQALKFANAKRNPRVYAHVMADALESYPMDVRRTATNMLAEVESTAPDSPYTAEAKLVKYFPDMAVHPEWFREFFEELRLRLGIITPDDDEEGGEEGGDEEDEHYSAPTGDAKK